MYNGGRLAELFKGVQNLAKDTEATVSKVFGTLNYTVHVRLAWASEHGYDCISRRSQNAAKVISMLVLPILCHLLPLRCSCFF